VSPRRSEDGILETQRLVDGLFCTCVCQPAASLFFSCCRGTARRSTTSDFTGDFFSAHFWQGSSIIPGLRSTQAYYRGKSGNRNGQWIF
jgi:hypothetical protein